MSTIVMAACWPLQGMSPAQKSVLISLADQASDEGVCWPGIGTIAKRTCLSERAVQEAMAWLQAVGLVFREYRLNTSTSYTVTPSSYDPRKAPAKRLKKKGQGTGARSAPGELGAPGEPGSPGGERSAPIPRTALTPGVRQAHLTGERGAPKSSMNRNLNRQGTAKEPFPAASRPAPKWQGAGQYAEVETAMQAACRATWEAYSEAYVTRYGVAPVCNAAVNASVKTLVKRLGHDEAPLVAAWYVEYVNEAFVVKNTHGFGLLANGAESYRTQWARGEASTSTGARQSDRTAANLNAIEGAKRILRQRWREEGYEDESVVDA